MPTARIAFVLGALLPFAMLAQSRFDRGEWKGFTKSPTEHVVNRYESVVEVRAFEGSIVDPTGAPIPGVVVEARGPGINEKVRGTMTDEQGRFKLGRMTEGSYAFKVTCNAFNRSLVR